MAIGLRFDKGASAGPDNQSREDFAVGEVCTIVATGVVGAATFEILAPPLGSTAALVPVDSVTQEVTIDVAGRWDIRVGDTADGSRVEHTFAAPTLLRGLIAPAHNERASEAANAADVDTGGTWVDESHSNLGGRFTGYAPDLQKAVNAIELNADLALGARETGWLSGGLITVNGEDPAKYDIAEGKVRIQGVLDPVTFGPFVAVDPLNLATEEFTRNFIDASGALVQLNAQLNSAAAAVQRKTAAELQIVLHVLNTTVSFDGFRQPSAHLPSALLDYVFFNGPLNVGNIYRGAATNDLALQKVSGTTQLPFINAIADPLNPGGQANPAIPSVLFLQHIRDGAGDYIFTPATTVPVGFWDDNTGSLVSTPKFVIHQMRFFNQQTGLIVGQTTYNTLSDALAAILTETFDIHPAFTAVGNNYRTAIIVKGNVTNLNSGADVLFFDLGNT